MLDNQAPVAKAVEEDQEARAQPARASFLGQKELEMVPPGIYREEREIEEVVKKFEACEYGLGEFPHGRHLTVAAWYLTWLSADEAMAAMRRGLLRFTQHRTKTGYHETITRFWMELVADLLRRQGPPGTLVQSVNALVECYADKKILFAYDSRDPGPIGLRAQRVVGARLARVTWPAGAIGRRKPQVQSFEPNRSAIAHCQPDLGRLTGQALPST